jgi:hypothetical protein
MAGWDEVNERLDVLLSETRLGVGMKRDRDDEYAHVDVDALRRDMSASDLVIAGDMERVISAADVKRVYGCLDIDISYHMCELGRLGMVGNVFGGNGTVVRVGEVSVCVCSFAVGYVRCMLVWSGTDVSFYAFRGEMQRVAYVLVEWARVHGLPWATVSRCLVTMQLQNVSGRVRLVKVRIDGLRDGERELFFDRIAEALLPGYENVARAVDSASVSAALVLINERAWDACSRTSWRRHWYNAQTGEELFFIRCDSGTSDYFMGIIR